MADGGGAGKSADRIRAELLAHEAHRSQAVRLPKDVAFPDGVKDVTVLRDGKRRIIVPVEAVWDDFFDAPGVDLGPREQPATQKREDF